MNPSEHEKKLRTYRLSQEEYLRIADLMGRPPQGLEWALFSALWSEHCSYKSSKVHLKNLFSRSERVVQGFGENAGVIDLGQGERVAFKIESHNHPSYIEPYQGAATGVGGILRDIFTMGARPIALANYLCFGQASAERMPSIVDGVVRGIGGYGNCVGVPTITGQTEFHPSYDRNVLVNAMAVGLYRPGEKIFLSKASGPGCLVVYVGAKTGRDGVHGASMASESFGAESAAKRPTVQIGDPFLEKLLIESCLEVMQEDLVVAIQDMGAAGLTSSSFEMASKGGVGFTLHLDKVPLRDATMTPEDIMLSESQERMLLICEPSKLPRIVEIFSRWGLDAAAIGEVKTEKTLDIFWRGERLVKIDPDILVEMAPRYERPYQTWSSTRRSMNRPLISGGGVPLLKKQVASLQGSSRQWIYRQYDSRVGAATTRGCEDSVGIVRLKDSNRWLGVVLGCRPHVMRTDAQLGGLDAVAYPALELAAKGFETLAVTDCLNFGNPERPEIMSEFVASLDGMNSICRELKAPIISGNVSFYNETMGRNITSTPATGLVGLRADGQIPASQFENPGLKLYVIRLPSAIGLPMSVEGGDSTLHYQGEVVASDVARYIQAVREICSDPLVEVSRVVGKFGLLYTLFRMSEKMGFDLKSGFLAELRGVTGAQTDLLWSELSIEPFYEVIVGVTGGPAEAWASKARAIVTGAMSITEIGQTAKGIYRLGELGTIETESMHQMVRDYHMGFEQKLGFLQSH